MRKVLTIVALTFVAGLIGCAETASPPATPPVADVAAHVLRWAPSSGPRTFAVARPQSPAAAAAAAPLPPPSVLSTDSVSFWAYTLQDASVEIDYLADDGTWQPYVALAVPAGSLLRRPDGSLFLPGDSVQITLTADTTQMVVRFEPSGLTFNPFLPATLRFSYGGAGPDLNQDGVVNFIDRLIEQYLLGLYRQEDPTDDWVRIPAIKDLLSKQFTAQIRHFTGYAVSW